MPDAPTLAPELERLIAKDEIQTAKARFARFVDTNQWEALAGVLADDVVFCEHLVAFELQGREALIGALRDGMAGVVTVHHAHLSEITFLEPDRARGIWSLEDYLVFPPGMGYPGQTDPSSHVRGYGYYVDEFTRRDGAWLLSRIEIYRLRHEVTSYRKTELPDVLRG